MSWLVRLYWRIKELLVKLFCQIDDGDAYDGYDKETNMED